MPVDPPLSSTEWQRTAARKAFQGDLPGAISAMENAVRVDPDNFHHWMWLRHLFERAGDGAGAAHAARQGLRCLDEAPNPEISPEERTRLIVRAALPAGERDRAEAAVRDLESLRNAALEACENAEEFAAWVQADLFAAPIFETLTELHDLLGASGETAPFRARYARALQHGLTLATAASASDDDLCVIQKRLAAVR